MPIVVERIALWGLRPVGRGQKSCNPSRHRPENLDVGRNPGTSRQGEAAGGLEDPAFTLTWSPVFWRLATFAFALLATIAVAVAINDRRAIAILVLVPGVLVASLLPRVRWSDPARDARWRRSASRTMMATAIALGIVAWWNSELSVLVRRAANSMVYSGCQCDDCIRAFGLVSSHPGDRRGGAAWLIGTASVTAAVVGLRGLRGASDPDVPRRADGVAAKCTKCGYDMEGVLGAVCPECGTDCGFKGGGVA